MNDNKKVKQLRITLLAGLILFIFAGTALTVFYLIERSESKETRQKDNFNRIMREFDEGFDGLFFTGNEFERLNGQLDRLEGLSVTVESWLSILKRRRALADIHPSSAVNYKKSIENALAAFPVSQPITAIAAASLENDPRLGGWLLSLTEPHFNSFRLSFHVLKGDFENPAKAFEVPEDIYSDGTESITVNMAVLKTLHGDYRGALSGIQLILNGYSPELSDETAGIKPPDSILRFAAEFHYDFGNLLRSAEIFSLLDDEYALIRQADALYLCGFTDTAQTLWEILAGLSNETSLYNLAVTAEDSSKAALYLEKLVNIDTNKAAGEFGLIRYSRMLNYPDAVSFLQNKIKNTKQVSPYIDLEICKRHSRAQNPSRQAAEAWLLLDRHENNEEIYKWVFWNLFFQNNFDEAKILLRRIEMLKINWHWCGFYKAVFLMAEGYLEEPENILLETLLELPDWYVHANLGRILEAERSPSRALEQYQLAASKIELTNEAGKTASNIHVRIARCFTALKRPGDALGSLQYALELNPFNLTAQLELANSSERKFQDRF